MTSQGIKWKRFETSTNKSQVIYHHSSKHHHDQILELKTDNSH